MLVAAKTNPFRSGPAMLRSARADGWFPRVRDIARKELQQHFADAAKRAAKEQDPTSPELSDAWMQEWVAEMRTLILRMVEEGFIDTRNEFGEPELGKTDRRGVRGKQDDLELPDTGVNVLFQEAPLETEALSLTEAASVDSEFLRSADLSRVTAHLEQVGASVSKRSTRVIQAVFDRANAEGMTPSKIARELRKQGAARSTPRARMIARTETIWSYNEGAQQRYSSMGVVAKEWVTTKDDLLCPFCEPMDGVIVAVGDPFFPEGDSQIVPGKESGSQKMTFGMDVDHPPLHPNCRCTLVPVI